MNIKKPKIENEPDVEILTQLGKQYEIILFNDDVNSFEHVIETLVIVCDHSFEQAEQCAYLVHFSGKCGVKTGSYDELEPLCKRLLEVNLSVEIH
jgi:ATP-dependent Clp protease adaptor protein ClpS